MYYRYTVIKPLLLLLLLLLLIAMWRLHFP